MSDGQCHVEGFVMASYPAPRIPYTRWSKPRSCYTGAGYPKRRYETRAEAKRVARSLTQREGVPVTAYKCPVCDWFHVGHEPGGAEAA